MVYLSQSIAFLLQAAGSMSTAEEDFSTPAASDGGGSASVASGRTASFDPLGMVRLFQCLNPFGGALRQHLASSKGALEPIETHCWLSSPRAGASYGRVSLRFNAWPTCSALMLHSLFSRRRSVN